MNTVSARLSPLIKWRGLPFLLAVAGGLGACTPAQDWREIRPPEAQGLVARFPCKPEVHQRQVPISGVSGRVAMQMLSCQTGEVTWALAYAVVPDVTQVGPALTGLAQGMRGNLAEASRQAGATGEVTTTDLGPVDVPHMTPQAQARAWRFQAPRSDGFGRPLDVQVTAWHFSHGLMVFQASMSRPTGGTAGPGAEEAAQTFLRGFQFPG